MDAPTHTDIQRIIAEYFFVKLKAIQVRTRCKYVPVQDLYIDIVVRK